MEIQAKLLKFKFPIIFTTLLSFLFLFLFLLAPRFLTILSYFWPLFVSTALFLFAVVFFAKVSPPISETASCEKAGEGLLDYVAGLPDDDEILQHLSTDGEDEEEVEKEEHNQEDQKIINTQISDQKLEKSEESEKEILTKASEDDDR